MYSKLGANVVVNDVSEKGANSVVDEIVKGGLCFWVFMLETLLTPLNSFL